MPLAHAKLSFWHFILCHVVGCLKVQLNSHGMCDPSRIIKNTPIPFPYRFTAPSKYIFHASSSMFNISSFGKSSLPPSHSTGFSAQKFDMALPLIVFLAAYSKSNLANRISHLDNLLIKVGFSNKYFRGYFGYNPYLER